MVVTVLKIATRILIQVVLIQVRMELVGMRVALKVALKGMVAIKRVQVAIKRVQVVVKRVQVVVRMAQAQITAAQVALREMTPVETMKMATLIWTMETMTVTVGIRMTEEETPVKKGTLMRKGRLG
jgi:hypothetical protein